MANVREDKKRSLFEKQAMMDKTQKATAEKNAARNSSLLKKVRIAASWRLTIFGRHMLYGQPYPRVSAMKGHVRCDIGYEHCCSLRSVLSAISVFDSSDKCRVDEPAATLEVVNMWVSVWMCEPYEVYDVQQIQVRSRILKTL